MHDGQGMYVMNLHIVYASLEGNAVKASIIGNAIYASIIGNVVDVSDNQPECNACLYSMQLRLRLSNSQCSFGLSNRQCS